MPHQVSNVFFPENGRVYEIKATQKRVVPNVIGIKVSKGQVAFFHKKSHERILTGKKTGSGWQYYPVPQGICYVVFKVERSGSRTKCIRIEKLKKQHLDS